MTFNVFRTLAIGLLVVAALQLRQAKAVAPDLSNNFDRTTGANTYLGPFANTPYGLNDSNWVTGQTGIKPHAGSHAFMSANGNQATDFLGNGIRKALGGTIELKPYDVSFSVATYLSLEGVELSDFSTLRIGGPFGQTQWLSTPKPSVNGLWLTWQGRYSPAPGDVGLPFQFEAIWDLDARHAIALDGPATAIAVPEPSALLVLVAAIYPALALWRR